MFSTIILSMALAFVAVAQTLSRVRCRSLECIRTVDDADTRGIDRPTGDITAPPQTPRQTTRKRPTLTVPNCSPFVRRTDGLDLMSVSPAHSTM